MKKMVIMFVVVLSSGMINAHENNYSIQRERAQGHGGRFLDADQLVDEYGRDEEHQSAIDEYDQHVCDDVKPQKISDAQAFLTKIVGRLLVHCFIIKEKASSYLQKLKDITGAWFNSVVKP